MSVLFENMISKMKRANWFKTLWINLNDLKKIKHQKLRCMLVGCGEFFEYFGIEINTINKIQQFEWKIENDDYKQFVNLSPREYINSNQYQYKLNKESIKFWLKCCNKFTNKSPKVALYLHLDYISLPKHITSIRIEYDLLCDITTKSDNNNKKMY